MSEKAKGIVVLLIVYAVACVAGYLAARLAWPAYLSGWDILWLSALAMGVAVVVIFAGSVIFNNSSVFDPYWSVAPPLTVLFLLAVRAIDVNPMMYTMAGIWEVLTGSPRISVLLFLTLAYGFRLTWNFLRGWPGLSHEDWRYRNFRVSGGRWYWLVSFSGIHFFPALMVFGGLLPVWVVVIVRARPINALDFAAVVVTCLAILLEAASDSQMRQFLKENRDSGKTMDRGLWSVSRHPNYLGEILFWWGLWLFAMASYREFWWVVAGPVAITLMFLFASIPMIEKRMLQRRSDYEEYRARVSMLLPMKWGNKKMGEEEKSGQEKTGQEDERTGEQADD